MAASMATTEAYAELYSIAGVKEAHFGEVYSWGSETEINSVGSATVIIPMNQNDAEKIEEYKRIKLYRFVPTGRQFVTHFIIVTLDLKRVGEHHFMATLSGPTIADELSQQKLSAVSEIKGTDSDVVPEMVGFIDPNAPASWTMPEVLDNDPSTSRNAPIGPERYLYIGSKDMILGLSYELDLGQPANAQPSILDVQLYNGPDEWYTTTLNLNTSESVAGTPFSATTGTIEWDLIYNREPIPVLTLERLIYWVRISCPQQLDTVWFRHIRIKTYAKSGTDYALIMSNASGWSLSGSYYDSSANGSMSFYNDVSINEALFNTAKRQQEAIRFNLESLEVEALRQDVEDSGITVMNRPQSSYSAFANTNIAFIEDLDYKVDASRVATRLHLVGSGSGSERISIADADPSLIPAGYSYSLADGYIQHDDAVAKYGVIESTIRFAEIYNKYSNQSSPTSADELLVAGLAHLSQVNGYPRAPIYIDLAITKVHLPLKVGQSVNILFNGFSPKSGRFVSINNEAWFVQKISIKGRPDKDPVYKLTVSNVRIKKMTSSLALSEMLMQLRMGWAFDSITSADKVSGFVPQKS